MSPQGLSPLVQSWEPPARSGCGGRSPSAHARTGGVGLASLKPADLKIAGSAACGSYIQGYTTGVLGGALLFLGPHFGLTPAQIGAVATATTLGSVLGTFSASALADAAGRRPTMAFSSALFVAASVLMVWTPSLDVLVLARFLAGVGIGNCGAVVPVYVAECAEAASRGLVGAATGPLRKTPPRRGGHRHNR